MVDAVVIGGGPAGLTAALYLRRYGLDVLVLEQGVAGGQIVNTPNMENYPGFQSISGVDFTMQLVEQINSLGVELRSEAVLKADLRSNPKRIETSGGEYEAKTVIIANGARRRKLGCPGEERLEGRGVSYCATCDGAFFRNKDVAVVGGGNTALEDALFLSKLCSKVYLIHRRDSFRAEETYRQAVTQQQNIEILYHSVVEEIVGEQKVEGIVVRTGDATTQNLSVSGVFVAVGLVPDNGIFAGQLPLDEGGYLMVGEDCKTPIEGVYVAGDTRTKQLRQVVTAAADGAVAAAAAANRLGLKL